MQEKTQMIRNLIANYLVNVWKFAHSEARDFSQEGNIELMNEGPQAEIIVHLYSTSAGSANRDIYRHCPGELEIERIRSEEKTSTGWENINDLDADIR